MGIFCNGSEFVKSTSNYTRARSDHTVMFWLRRDSTGTDRPFGNTGAWESRTSGSTTLTSDYLQSGSLVTVPLPTGTIYHVAFVQDITNSQKRSYRDGQLSNTVNSSSFANAQTNVIGIGITGNRTSQGWAGIIDDIRVYDRALTQEEIQTIYECRGTDGIIDDLALHYPMDEGPENTTVSTLFEVTGNGPDCTAVTGTPTYNYDTGIKYRRMA